MNTVVKATRCSKRVMVEYDHGFFTKNVLMPCGSQGNSGRVICPKCKRNRK